MEISDRTLIVLTVIALVTTVGGTLTILQSLGPDLPYLTGFATSDTGVVNVTIAAAANIAFIIDIVDFGTGSSPAAGILDINTSDTLYGGGTNPSTFDDPGPLSYVNDGNVDINVTLNGSNAATFLGGTSPTYEFISTAPGTDDGCGQGLNRTNNATKTTIDSTLRLICENLTFADAADTSNISIFLGLPSDISTGLKQDTLISIFAIQLE